jgi:hypothetical protein
MFNNVKIPLIPIVTTNIMFLAQCSDVQAKKIREKYIAIRRVVNNSPNSSMVNPNSSPKLPYTPGMNKRLAH